MGAKYRLDAEKPGFLNESLELFGEINKNKDIKLAIDGKKLAPGIGHHVGEEDLCGHEETPTLGKYKFISHATHTFYQQVFSTSKHQLH